MKWRRWMFIQVIGLALVPLVFAGEPPFALSSETNTPMVASQSGSKTEVSLELCQQLAEQGDAVAQFVLGGCYAHGKGLKKDSKEAAKWYRKAAEQGYALAQLGLGFCYAQGKGVGKDPGKAVVWYRKAAEQGNPMAQFCLAGCYDQGEGVEGDPKQAADWYAKAAEQGYSTLSTELPPLAASDIGKRESDSKTSVPTDLTSDDSPACPASTNSLFAFP